MPIEAPLERHDFLGIEAIVASDALRSTLERARRFASSTASVLIEGETGSGKEIVARAIHHFSNRSLKPWVDISCAALPDNLVESELFGYERGAFSGANGRKPGLFEIAQGGTLLLDEIGELDAKPQAKLLRVLDYGEFYRLGGTHKVKVDVRIIAATNRNLEEAVAAGRFREDLFHRLAQLRIRVPSLRERVDDILPLAELFRARSGLRQPFSAEARRALLAYDWPGNVRELRNVVTGCCHAEGEEITLEDLPAALRSPGTFSESLLRLAERAETPVHEKAQGGLLETAERELILRALEQAGGHHERAARALGISTRTLSRKLKLYLRAGLNQEPSSEKRGFIHRAHPGT
jgi:transcriptional regulator with PAS, ATPase and Fis domain